MFASFAQPTSKRTIWITPHQNLASTELAKIENKNKLMYNDGNGEIKFMDFTFMDDIEEYPSFADFPINGDPAKMYFDIADNKAYKWSGSQYFYSPHDVYSKTECDNQYYQKENIYTKTETDNKYTIRAIVNDMTNTTLNNIQTISILNCLTANSSSISITKPLYAGWQNFDFVNAINNKLLLDGTTVRINCILDLENNNIIDANLINVTNLETDIIKRKNGVQMLNFNADNAVDFNSKDIWKASSIECTMLRRQNAVEMITLANDTDINFNAKNIKNANEVVTLYAVSTFIYNSGSAFTNILRVNEIQNGSNVPIISLGGDNAINCNGKNIIEVNNGTITNVETDNIKRKNGVSMITLQDDIGMSFNAKDLRNTNIIQVNTFSRPNTTEMMAFPDDNTIHCRTKNLTNVNIINVSNVETDIIKRKNGTLFISMETDTNMNFNYRNISNVGTVELAGLKHDDGTNMITFTDNANINFNGKTLNSIGNLNMTGNINGKFSVSTPDIEMYDHLQMSGNDVTGVATYFGTNGNFTNVTTVNCNATYINDILATEYCISVKKTMTSIAGNKYYHYYPPAGYIVVSGCWTFGTGILNSGSMTDSVHTAFYNDPSAPQTVTFRGMIAKAFSGLGSTLII
jgi:hypothetical protein